jgi:hypothetical protein
MLNLYMYTHSSDAIHVALASHLYRERENYLALYLFLMAAAAKGSASRRNSGGVLDGWISYKANLLESLVKTCFMRRALLV